MKSFQKIFIVMLFPIFLLSTGYGQIQSTIAGGSWDDPLTWVGGVAPGPSDDVIINGPVGVHTTSCLSLTIMEDGVLFNDISNHTLTVSGDIINIGMIRDHETSGYTLALEHYGNLTNNGSIENYYFYFYGDLVQYLSLQPGKTLAPSYLFSFKTGGLVEALTDLDLTNCSTNFNYDQIVLQNGGKISVHGGNLWNTIITTADINGEGFQLFMDNDAYFKSCSLTNVELLGTAICNGSSFFGNTIISGTVYNKEFSDNLLIEGNITNNGVMTDSPVYEFGLSVYIKGNITNNGTWDCSYTYLTGTTDQYVTIQNNNEITGQTHYQCNTTGSPYQWYWDGSPMPPSSDYSGQTAQTLIFNIPVSASMSGSTLYCQSAEGPSRNIYFGSGGSGFNLALKAFLEGPYNGADMSTNLNTAGLLPLEQPYSDDPFGYPGIESVPFIPNTDVVDWVAIELRDAPDAATAYSSTFVAAQAGFILKDGSIVGMDGVSPLAFNCDITQNLFAIVWHRNHLGVMNATPLVAIENTFHYDFTTGPDQAYGGAFAHNDLGDGIYGLIGGNANGDGVIDLLDGTEAWIPQAGTSGYNPADVNLDGQVENVDKNDIWLNNYGKSDKVPTVEWTCGNAYTDSRDWQSYNTVQIGEQCWMAENLNIGTMINGTSSASQNELIEKYCYGNSSENCNEYGGLYSWNEMMQYSTTAGVQGICDGGWHIPTDAEWCTLEQFVDASISCSTTGARGIDGGGKLKETGTAHWITPNEGATNITGFSALPGGYRSSAGILDYMGYYGYWWTSSESSSTNAWLRHLYYDTAKIRRDYIQKTWGFGVRCIKNLDAD